MDGQRFDDLARTVARSAPGTPSRRAVLKGMLGAAVAAFAGGAGAAAKDKNGIWKGKCRTHSDCPAGAACVNNHCACPPGTTRCHVGTSFEACADTATDVNNCGFCGSACGPCEECIGGACVPTCGPCTECDLVSGTCQPTGGEGCECPAGTTTCDDGWGGFTCCGDGNRCCNNTCVPEDWACCNAGEVRCRAQCCGPDTRCNPEAHDPDTGAPLPNSAMCCAPDSFSCLDAGCCPQPMRYCHTLKIDGVWRGFCCSYAEGCPS